MDGGAQASHGCAEGACFGKAYPTLSETPELAGFQRRIRQNQPLGALVEVYLHASMVSGALGVHYDTLTELRMAHPRPRAETGRQRRILAEHGVIGAGHHRRAGHRSA